MWRVKALVNATWAFKNHSTTPQYLNWLLKRNVEEHPRTHKQIFPLLFDFVILCQWADFNGSHTHTRTYVCYVQNTHTSSLIPQPAELADPGASTKKWNPLYSRVQLRYFLFVDSELQTVLKKAQNSAAKGHEHKATTSVFLVGTSPLLTPLNLLCFWSSAFAEGQMNFLQNRS